MLFRSKGFFDPYTGFKPTSDFPAGTSMVISNKINKYSSFVFRGAGASKINNDFYYTSTITINEDSLGQPTPDHYGHRSHNRDHKLDPNFKISIENNWTNTMDGLVPCSNGPLTIYTIPETGILDNLTIKDIEVKLNFLNYINPKNLIVWLDVLPGSTYSAPTNTVESKPITDFSSDNTSLNNYYNSLLNLNSSKKTYLLNQEHISNYGSNFSVTFSDNINKYFSINQNNLFHSTKAN